MDENKYVKGNLHEYEQPYEDVRETFFKKYNFGDGAECIAYIPENVTADTKIMVYYPGQNFKGGWYTNNGSSYVQNYLMKEGSDAIVLMPDVYQTAGKARVEFTLEMIEQVQKEYNLTNTDIEYSGWSLGADDCLQAAASYIEKNPNAEPQICVTVDGYNNFWYNPDTIIPKIKDEFIENGTILIALEAPWKKDVLNLYAQEGINVLRVLYDGNSDMDMIQNGNYYIQENSGGYHNVVNQHFFKDGFSDFISGNKELPNEGYVYQRYDIEKGEWVTVDPSLINTYDKLNAFFENDVLLININKLAALDTIDITKLPVTSDSEVLIKYINNIIVNIKNSAFIQNEINYNKSFSSTTNIPIKIPSIVQSFYTSTTNLLLKLANDVKEFTKIGESIEKIDKAAAQETEELGNIITLTTGTVATPKQEQTIKASSEITFPKTEINIKEEVKTENESKEEQITETQNQKQTSTNNQSPKKENNNKQSGVATNNNASTSQTKEKNPLDEFPDYKEVYSDDTKIVYDYNNEYKIIVHKDGDEIIGLEHYYEFENENVANKALDTLSLEYKNNENVKNIVQKDQYVKVIFKEAMYKNLTINEIRNQYIDLSEVINL